MSHPLSDEALNTIFREARTHAAWLDKPVGDDLLRKIYDLAKFGPTSANTSPMRAVFVKSKEAKEKLKPALMPGNVDKTMAAPVTAIVASDSKFYEFIPKLWFDPKFVDYFTAPGKEEFVKIHALRNGSLQGAYLIIAARALGLDAGPMSGFDNAKVDADFFPDGRWQSNFLINIGYGDASKLHPRNARLEFEDACKIYLSTMRFLPSAQEVHGQFADAPRWYRILIRFRFLLAGIYFVSLVLSLGWLGWLGSRALSNDDRIPLLVLIGGTVLLFIFQAMLLAGAPQFRNSRPIRRRHKIVSLIAGALAAGALTYGFIATITSLFGNTMGWTSFFGDSYQPFVVLIGIPWLFWFFIFGVLWARRWTAGFGKMYRVLVAGTFAEVLFTVPVDVMVRRRTSCYCDEGTFAALIVGATTAMWTFGPGVALLFLAVRLQRRQRKGICLRCGYDLRSLPENRCPECGLAFEREDQERKTTIT